MCFLCFETNWEFPVNYTYVIFIYLSVGFLPILPEKFWLHFQMDREHCLGFRQRLYFDFTHNAHFFKIIINSNINNQKQINILLLICHFLGIFQLFIHKCQISGSVKLTLYTVNLNKEGMSRSLIYNLGKYQCSNVHSLLWKN